MFFLDAWDIMDRVRRKVGTAAREDQRFRENFGAPFTIVQMVWDMLEEGGLLPEKGEPKHLLWALYFLKCYPKEGPGCAVVGGSKGAINPKTMRKWVWLFLERICKLADHVVSLFFASFFHVFFSRLFFTKQNLTLPLVVAALSRNHRLTSRAVSSTTSLTIVS